MIEFLSKDTLHEICKWLDLTSLFQLSQTCKTLQKNLEEDCIWKQKAMELPIYAQLERIKLPEELWKAMCKKYVITINYPHHKMYQRRMHIGSEAYNTLEFQDNCQFNYKESYVYLGFNYVTVWTGIYLIDPQTKIVHMWYFAIIKDVVLVEDKDKESFGMWKAAFKEEMDVVEMKNVELFSNSERVSEVYEKEEQERMEKFTIEINKYCF